MSQFAPLSPFSLSLFLSLSPSLAHCSFLHPPPHFPHSDRPIRIEDGDVYILPYKTIKDHEVSACPPQKQASRDGPHTAYLSHTHTLSSPPPLPTLPPSTVALPRTADGPAALVGVISLRRYFTVYTFIVDHPPDTPHTPTPSRRGSAPASSWQRSTFCSVPSDARHALGTLFLLSNCLKLLPAPSSMPLPSPP